MRDAVNDALSDALASQGIALLCNAEGTVERVIRDDLGVVQSMHVGSPFAFVVDRSSVTKALNFLMELQYTGAAFDWQLNVPLGAEVIPLHFGGGLLGEHLLIVGAQSQAAVHQLYEELMRIGNEQANALRAVLKAQSEATRARDSSAYDELSRLNNELANLQRELARKNAELARLNEQQNRFLGMAAHDLRNPLHIIMNYSEFMLDHMPEACSQEQREFLRIIQSSSEFMAALINDLLDISQIEAGKLNLELQPLDLGELVRRNVALNAVLAARKEIAVRFEPEGDVPTVAADASKIEQVLNNLIGNAVKFSQPGSTVRVRLGLAAGEVHLAVQDEGPGIPEAERDRLFKPFSRTSVRSTAGEKSTGLGLVIVRHIVEGHGGRIWVESEVGRGSTFTVALPAT